MSEPTDPFSATTDVRALVNARAAEGTSDSAQSGAQMDAQSSAQSGAQGSAQSAVQSDAQSTSIPPSSSLIEDGSPVAEGEILAGKYQVERVLGRGGVGVVVAATHLRLKQRVAIKFLLSNSSSEMTERFLREAQASVKLKSEHAAKVLDVGELPNGAPYMVMEFLEGSDLSDHLMFQGPLPVEEAVEYVLQACEAMAEAHAAGIVHRDLKPANLFLTQTGGRKIVKVLDFGISKDASDPGGGRSGMSLTKTTAVFGSPLYMPPEQMRSAREVDARSDIWAIGVILYELLTGRTPFDAELYPDLVVKISISPADPPSSIRKEIPAKLDAVVLKCLEKSADNRYQDVSKLAAALAPFAPVHARSSADRISRTLDGAGPTGGGPGGSGVRAATQAKMTPSGRAGSGTTGGRSSSLMWKVVALAVVGSAALVIIGAALLGVFKGSGDKAGQQPITQATDATTAPNSATTPGNSQGNPPVGVTPAGEPSSITTTQGGSEAGQHGANAKTGASGSPQKGAPSSTPASGSAQASTGPAPTTQAGPTASTPVVAPPPPTAPPTPTKKNPLDMELQ